MKKRIIDLVKKSKVIVLTACVQLFVPLQVYASEQPIFVTGTQALLEDLKVIFLGFVAIVAVLLEIVNGFMYMLADEDTKPKYVKRVKQIIVAAVGILIAGETVLWILSHYM